MLRPAPRHLWTKSIRSGYKGLMNIACPARQDWLFRKGRRLLSVPSCVFAAFVLLCVAEGGAAADRTKREAANDALGKGDRADKLVSEGVALRRKGLDAKALTRFEEAYEINPSPRTASQLALCLQALGRFGEASVLFAKALDSDDSWVAGNRPVLQEAYEATRSKVAQLELLGTDGASVSVNGMSVGVLPLHGTVPVDEGVVTVVATMPGFKDLKQNLTVKGFQHQRLVLELEPIKSREESAPVAVAAEPPPEPRADKAPLYRQTWFWVTVGAVIVGAVATTVFVGQSGTSQAPAPDGFTTLESPLTISF